VSGWLLIFELSTNESQRRGVRGEITRFSHSLFNQRTWFFGYMLIIFSGKVYRGLSLRRLAFYGKKKMGEIKISTSEKLDKTLQDMADELGIKKAELVKNMVISNLMDRQKFS